MGVAPLIGHHRGSQSRQEMRPNRSCQESVQTDRTRGIEQVARSAAVQAAVARGATVNSREARGAEAGRWTGFWTTRSRRFGSGVEDYETQEEARSRSAVRNLHAGLLLLAKWVLVKSVPNASEDEVIATFYEPMPDGKGGVRYVPARNQTIGLQEIPGRFKRFGSSAEREDQEAAGIARKGAQRHRTSLHGIGGRSAPADDLGGVPGGVGDVPARARGSGSAAGKRMGRDAERERGVRGGTGGLSGELRECRVAVRGPAGEPRRVSALRVRVGGTRGSAKRGTGPSQQQVPLLRRERGGGGRRRTPREVELRVETTTCP